MLKDGSLEVQLFYRVIGEECYFVTCMCGEKNLLVNIDDWSECPKCGREYKMRERITVLMRASKDGADRVFGEAEDGS